MFLDRRLLRVTYKRLFKLGIGLDGNRFFKFVWRFNALTILLLLLVGIATVLWEMGLRRIISPRNVSEVVNIDQSDPSIVEKQNVDITAKIEGHDLFLASVENQQHYATKYSSKGTRNTRLNIGPFDP